MNNKFLKISKGIVKSIIIGSLSINLILIIILLTPLTKILYKPLIINELPKESEVIVVMSAGMYDLGIPDFNTSIRIRKGLELYRKNIANKIICVGGVKLKSNKSIAEIMKETFVLYGVFPQDILTHDETINTYNDITFLLNKYKKTYDFNNAVFVTASYHTFRVKQVLRKKNVNATVVSADPYELHPEVWSEKLGTFCDVIREYLSICYFKLKGWI